MLLRGRYEEFLKLDRKDLYTIILTYNLAEDMDVKTLISTDKGVLTDNKMEMLQKRAVDVLVTGGLQSHQASKKSLKEFLYVPRIVRARKDGKDGQGISRCGYIIKGFDSKVFIETKVTPGEENLCNHDEVGVTVENVPSLINPFQYPADEVELDSEEPEAVETNFAAFVDNISDNMLDEEMQERETFDEEHSCSAIPDIIEDESALDNSITDATQRLINLKYEVPQDHFSYNKRFMTKNEAIKAAVCLNERISFAILLERFKWLEFIPDQHNPRVCRFRCGLCASYAKVFKLSRAYMSEFSDPNGVDGSLIDTAVLSRHARGGEHRLIMTKLKQSTLEQLMDYDYELQTQDEQNLEVTAKMMHLVSRTFLLMFDLYYKFTDSKIYQQVYLEIKLGLSFHSHPSIVNFMERNFAAPLGFHHYR